MLRCDNVPEPVCAAMADWAGQRVGLAFISPGQPWRNGYIESFNGRLALALALHLSEMLAVSTWYSQVVVFPGRHAVCLCKLAALLASVVPRRRSPAYAARHRQ